MIILPLYRLPPSAYSITNASLGLDVAPYNLTILGCDTLDSCLNSTLKACLSCSVSMILTATCLPRQIPRLTTPKVPLPTIYSNHYMINNDNKNNNNNTSANKMSSKLISSTKIPSLWITWLESDEINEFIIKLILNLNYNIDSTNKKVK